MSKQVDIASNDLNNVIATAVQARIETEVASALSGSELMSQYVAAALTQNIQVKDRNSYRERTTTYLRETIDETVRQATKKAVEKIVAEEAPQIEKAVTAELRKNVKGISAQIVGNLVDKADSPYGITVEVKYPGKDADF
jgi:cell division ATPase FtsA